MGSLRGVGVRTPGTRRPTQEPPSPMDPGDPILDPVTTLAFLAGRTRSVRLGTGVIVLPFRNPLIFAKDLATVDVLSGGRLIFGIGVGYVQREFEALGVPYAGRGARTEEYLAAIRAVWTEPHPSYQGDLISFKGVQANPRPVQRPHPPVVIGGYRAPPHPPPAPGGGGRDRLGGRRPEGP